MRRRSTGFLESSKTDMDEPSCITGMRTKDIPWTTMCSLQFVRFITNFSCGDCNPLTRKMNATAPYKMEYSDLMMPPWAATSASTGQPGGFRISAVRLGWRCSNGQTLLGKKYANRQLRPNPMANHWERIIFKILETAETNLFGFFPAFAWSWSLSEELSAIVGGVERPGTSLLRPAMSRNPRRGIIQLSSAASSKEISP